MKNASNNRRGRPRSGGGKSRQGSRNRNYDSHGPESKVRGSAQQVLDKYLAMARDAQSAGDRIAAEGYFQHAEHYYRVLNDRQDQQKKNQNDRQQNSGPQGQDNANKPKQDENVSAEAPADNVSADGAAEKSEEPSKPRRKRRPSKSDDKAVQEVKIEMSEDTAPTGNDGDDEAAA
ncbi:MAG: DUF4167 domain-containing protein [Rhodospirillaceae bacterium]|jgi:hypothetical protein|nr:DUF4167 domain-containing protein [Rhodospirillaceae bacterium]MBT4219321.1 DUF4167 domain-containing protein [Rhodospirillaceae bacterium]MBT4464619.1 DUF4167 domain-containing protein [Rhodospirillaceae bacterium]MBT5014361.1 DUF4167 domain-containing protein [Rhodospirillaceae bacterium]MBT6405984.1 DUF4167 domain-containing protein [Rhodospirillaceae bacterium]